MALGNLIKSWENIMRDDDGVSGTVQVLSQLVWMLFLKVYDLKEDEWELYEDNFESAIPENCRWRNWAKGKTQKDKITGDEMVDFVNNTLFPTLKELPVTSQSSKRRTIVKEMMAESYNYMKDGVCIRKAADLLDGINFDDQEEHHSFNMIYETLLRGLQSAGRSGEFYTPRALTQLITEKVNPKLGKVTADFACGTGGFLIDAVEHLRGQVTRAEDYAVIEQTVMGVEKKQLPYMLCTTNMLLHDVNYPQITHGNSLQKNVRDYSEEEKVDFILMNPPYGGHEQDGIQVNFPSRLRSSETANLFMVEILYRLRENGRCGVILPDGFLQNDDASLIRIKEKLFSECNVHTIIRMPGSCFAPYTSIATNLLFFDKTGATTETWFYRFDLPNGQKFSMKRNPITREKLAAIDEWWDNRTEIKDEKTDASLSDTWKSQCVSMDIIVDRNYNIDFCGFPNEEKVILSPEDLLEDYINRRTHLEKRIDIATSALGTYLNGQSDVRLFNIGSLTKQLSELDRTFPSDLRAAILQAAMQGKLSEQLDTDSSVDESIRIIEQEKLLRIKSKDFKVEKKVPEIVEIEPRYDIPTSWRWLRLYDIGSWGAGATPRRGESKYYLNGTIPWIKTGELNDGFITSSEEMITETALAECSLKLNNIGDVMIAMYGATIGKLGIAEIQATTNQACCVCSPFSQINNRYLFYFLMSNKAEFIGKGAGSGQPNISKEKIIQTLIPIPPIEEQQRIVERLDVLLPLCDELTEE